VLELDLSFARGSFRLEMQLTLSRAVSAIHGPSGSGKTTLLDLVAGLLRPERGWIRLDGETLFDARAGIDLPPERRRLGYLFQEGRLFPHLSVEGNLRYGLRRRRGNGPDLAAVADVLELSELLGRSPDRLSGGEKQRVALGRALLSNPRLLVLDEPLASLDGDLKERILPFLGRTVERFDIPMLYVSHFPQEVLHLADEVVLFEAGGLRAQGDPRRLLRTSGSEAAPPDGPVARGGAHSGANS